MKIVIAPDSFKESLSALEVAEAIEAGFKQIFPEACYVKLPWHTTKRKTGRVYRYYVS